MNKGFTIIETMIAILIFILGLGTLFGMVVNLYRTQNYTLQQSQAIAEAKRGIETMTREIREATTAQDGSYIIESADDFELIFYSDIDKDEDIERVRYFVEGTEFKKGVAEPSQVSQISDLPVEYLINQEKIYILSRYVRNSPPVFEYYDENGQKITSYPARRKDTKLIKLTLVINVDPNRPPQDFVLETEVQIRNLKSNL